MTRSEAVDAYADGPRKLRDAVAGLTPAQLQAYPVPGTWSIHEIVVHLMDSDLIASDRMKRVIAEPRPLLVGYDETALIRALRPHEQSLADALTLFELNRRQTTIILRGLDESAFERWGVHNEAGKKTLADLVAGYVEHLDHHLGFIHKKRKLLGA